MHLCNKETYSLVSVAVSLGGAPDGALDEVAALVEDMQLSAIETVYHYGDDVARSHQLLHLTPRDQANQNCHSRSITLDPEPSTRREYIDARPTTCAWNGSSRHRLGPGLR
jgi:hypothetical protein